MPIAFPIVELMSSQSSYEWLVAYFHPQGLSCPHCGATAQNARDFRVTKSSQVPDYRCRRCNKTYNVYSRTVFEGRRLTPPQVVLLVCTFMRLFRSVHKKYLSGYLAICEFHINPKRISPAFIAALVAAHLELT